MLALFLLSASLFLKSAESCSVLPVVRDVCDSEVRPCLITRSVDLRCAVDREHSSSVVGFQWFNASTRDWSSGLSEPNPALQGSQVTITSEGYWWCRVTVNDGDTQLCSSVVPVAHYYPCSCSPAGFDSLRLCPISDSTCDIVLSRHRCAAIEQSSILYCLTMTTVEVATVVQSVSSTPTQRSSVLEPTGVVRNALSLSTHDHHHVAETKRMYTKHTQHFPYQTRHSHHVTTPETKPSGTPAIDKAHNSGSDMVVKLLYIVGPIVVVLLVSIIVMLVVIGCVHHRRKKYSIGETRQHNRRRSTASNGRSKEEHIYDTVVLVKGGSLSSHYTTHTKLLSTPAEYEVPVNKHQVSKPITTQTNESYAVNPVSLAVFGNGQVPVTTTE